MKLKPDVQIIERAEKKVYLVCRDKELCISDDSELETVVNMLYFENADVVDVDAKLNQLDGFIE